MLFHSWYDLLRVLVVGACGYGGLICILRATGKRTLSKMNAFDLVVTISLGSTLASLILNSDVSLSEGLLALALLCGLQYAVAFTSMHSPKFQRLIKAEPTLLFFRGRYQRAMLRKERVTEEEVVAAIRAQGVADLASVAAVVLETDGSFSVIADAANGSADSLKYVATSGDYAADSNPKSGPPGGPT